MARHVERPEDHDHALRNPHCPDPRSLRRAARHVRVITHGSRDAGGLSALAVRRSDLQHIADRALELRSAARVASARRASRGPQRATDAVAFQGGRPHPHRRDQRRPARRGGSCRGALEHGRARKDSSRAGNRRSTSCSTRPSGFRRSSDIPAAAAAIADIGIACGACHKVAGGPTAKADAPPSTDATLASRMRRHVWATDRLWEGIIVPSDASWKAGAAALSGEPFPKEVLDRGDVHARGAADRFKSLVATAASKKKPDERGQLYATLLETCSACHVVTRKK